MFFKNFLTQDHAMKMKINGPNLFENYVYVLYFSIYLVCTQHHSKQDLSDFIYDLQKCELTIQKKLPLYSHPLIKLSQFICTNFDKLCLKSL